jgi:uncharacterized lipoprotein YbaY
MRHLAFSAVAALALTAACKDQPKQTPTEPAAAVVSAPARIADQEGESSLCAAYRERLVESRAALERSPRDASLRDAVATYEAVFADACSTAP